MTTITINDDVINRARAITALKNDKDIVEVALEGYIDDLKQQSKLLECFGKLHWDPEFAGVADNKDYGQ
jgi:hypothetical protein